MKTSILFALILFALIPSYSQSDYLVLKKKNNRTLKTYFPGTFISAVTYSGFTLNGVIRNIRNDSIFVEQQNVYQVGTQFGVPALDTIVYTLGVYYQEIVKFNYNSHTGPGGAPRSRGSSPLLIPRILATGGAGYIVLELINSAYRKEKLNDGNKLVTMGIAAGVATTGIVWMSIARKRDKPGKKYNVIYVDMTKR